jgi:hypothetical protein
LLCLALQLSQSLRARSMKMNLLLAWNNSLL